MKMPDERLMANMVEVPEGMHDFLLLQQVPGAWPKGTRIKKAQEEAHDLHAIGEKAVVVASVPLPPPLWQKQGKGVMYLLRWDNEPQLLAACVDWKLEKDDDHEPT